MQLVDHMFFTELVGLKVYDLKGRKLGVVRDAALVPLVDAVRVDRFLLGGGWAWLTIRHDQVERIGLDGIWLRDEILTPYHRDDYMLRIGRDLLDQQIIDVDGRKVVRVTDVTFERVSREGYQELRVLEVDVGLRSIFRRLTQGVVPRTWVRKVMLGIPVNSIRWEMCNIVESDPQRRLRLNISHDKLESMHPSDLAEIVEALGPRDREAIIGGIDEEVAADALSEIDPDIQASILENLDEEKAAGILEEMSPDQAADVLSELEDEKSVAILDEMEDDEKREVEELMEFEEDSAGALMNTEYVTIPESATVAEAIAALVEQKDWLDNLNTLFLVDDQERLRGAVPIARLVAARGEERVAEFAIENMVSAKLTESHKRVAALFDKYNLLTLPIVDTHGKMAGIITADDVISLLRNP